MVKGDTTGFHGRALLFRCNRGDEYVAFRYFRERSLDGGPVQALHVQHASYVFVVLPIESQRAINTG